MNLFSKHETRRRLLRGLPDADMVTALLPRWFETPQGAEVLAAEMDVARPLIDRMFGYHILEVGFSEEHSLIESSPVGHKIRFTSNFRKGSSLPVANLHQLPLPADSIDAIVLHHALDFSDEPHALLREVTRVLRPGGRMLIVGFNPYSFWGLWKLFRRRINVPWRGRFIRKARLADWLQLLDLQEEKLEFALHFPPWRNRRILRSAKKLEHWGRRVKSPFGGAYITACVKQVIPITPVMPRWRPLRARTTAIPAAENIGIRKIH